MSPAAIGLVTVLAVLAVAGVMVLLEARRRAAYVRQRYAALRRRYENTEEKK